MMGQTMETTQALFLAPHSIFFSCDELVFRRCFFDLFLDLSIDFGHDMLMLSATTFDAYKKLCWFSTNVAHSQEVL